MATIVKKVDRGIDSGKRYQYWASGSAGTTWAQGDVIDVQATLGRPAKYVCIETSAGCNLQIRMNSQIEHRPMRDKLLNFPNREAFEDAVFSTDSSMNAIPIDAADTWEMDHVLPITDIQIVAWTAGTFEIIVA